MKDKHAGKTKKKERRKNEGQRKGNRQGAKWRITRRQTMRKLWKVWRRPCNYRAGSCDDLITRAKMCPSARRKGGKVVLGSAIAE